MDNAKVTGITNAVGRCSAHAAAHVHAGACTRVNASEMSLTSALVTTGPDSMHALLDCGIMQCPATAYVLYNIWPQHIHHMPAMQVHVCIAGQDFLLTCDALLRCIHIAHMSGLHAALGLT